MHLDNELKDVVGYERRRLVVFGVDVAVHDFHPAGTLPGITSLCPAAQKIFNTFTHVSEKDLSVFLCRLETAMRAASCRAQRRQLVLPSTCHKLGKLPHHRVVRVCGRHGRSRLCSKLIQLARGYPLVDARRHLLGNQNLQSTSIPQVPAYLGKWRRLLLPPNGPNAAVVARQLMERLNAAACFAVLCGGQGPDRQVPSSQERTGSQKSGLRP